MAKATASDNGPVSDKPQTPETQASASDQAQQPPPDNPPIPEKMPEGMQKPMDAAEKAAADAAQAAETAAEKAADAAKPVSTAAEKQDAKALQATIQKEIGGVAGKLAEGLIVTLPRAGCW